MTERSTSARTLDRIAADACALHGALRTVPTHHAYTLSAHITDAQALAGSALRLFLDLLPDTPHTTSADLLLLDRLAHITKAAQDAGAKLTAALARAVENRRHYADAASGPVVLCGPTPQQLIASAADLLDRIPALSRAVHSDQLLPPTNQQARLAETGAVTQEDVGLST